MKIAVQYQLVKLETLIVLSFWKVSMYQLKTNHHGQFILSKMKQMDGLKKNFATNVKVFLKS